MGPVTRPRLDGMTEPPPGDRQTTDAAHHAVSAHESVLMLETDHDEGLDEEVAATRLRSFGPNTLPRASGDSLPRRILQQFHNPLIYVLLAAAATTALLGEYVDTGVILGVVLVNALVGFVQESRALAALESLRSMAMASARVVRAGRVRVLRSEELVPGDIVALESGEKVPADLRLLRSAELLLDESALTGESAPVLKGDAVLPEATRVADRHNMLYAGTLVHSGSGAGIVVATGAGTELGEIHRLVGGATSLATPLTRKLAHFSRILTVAILALAALTFLLGTARGEDPAHMFTAAVALAVGAIPEGLPAAVTITLAIGVSRMVRRRAVVRRLPAVETLGSTTVICTDKTGTLTTNEMTVRRIWTPDGAFDVRNNDDDGAVLVGVGEAAGPPERHAALRWTVTAGAACNDAEVSGRPGQRTSSGDPTEVAMKLVALRSGLGDGMLPDRQRVATIPFDSHRQYMATLHRSHAPERDVALVKGAAERVVDLCEQWMRADGTVEPLDRAVVVHAADELAAQGLRVLATAVAPAFPAGRFDDDDGLGGGMVLTGLQAMLDPPRSAAKEAITACHRAGIEVKMITGDHVATAAAIASELDLDHRPVAARRTVIGAELSTLTGDAYDTAVAETGVFARVSPEEKLRLVEALQHRGHVVAMTGDGVNDAPALQQADIGIAMGRGGTEVAKDAADMVLVDDDFATIEAAVEEGRGVFDNLTKFLAWTLPTNIGEGMVILVAIALGAALPILPTQILWINMTTAVALGLMLAFEPREPGVMDRPPRSPSRPLLTGDLVWRTLLISALLVAGAWWLFTQERARGAGLAEARTAALNIFVAVEIVYLFSCRSLTRSSWRLGFFSNRWLLVGVAIQVLAQLAITYVPAMNAVFDTAPIDVRTWVRIVAVALVAGLCVGVHKRLTRARSPAGPGPSSAGAIESTETSVRAPDPTASVGAAGSEPDHDQQAEHADQAERDARGHRAAQ